MKHVFTRLSVAFAATVMLWWGNSAFAQLSGTYTVGGSSPDYATVEDAINDLASVGLSGNATFNIRTGTYSGYHNLYGYYTGSGTYNATFQSESGNAADVVITSPSSSWYMYSVNNVDIKNVTISSFYDVMYVYFSTDVAITGCVLNSDYSNALYGYYNTGVSVSGSTINSVYGSYMYYSNDLSLTGNTFGPSTALAYGYYGIQSYYNTNINISGNNFNNITYYGVYSGQDDGLTVSSNNVTSSSSDYGYGIYVWGPRGNSDISKNKINLSSAYWSYGLIFDSYYYYYGSTTPLTQNISNNFISITSTQGGYGMLIQDYDYYGYGSMNNINVLHNSVHAYGSVDYYMIPFYFYSYSYYSSSTSTTSSINNNIFSNTSTSLYYPYYNSAAHVYDYDYYYGGSGLKMNYNNFWSTNPGGYLIQSYLGSHLTLADWQAASGHDLNSLNIAPGFLSDTDLHTNNTALAAGAPVGILDDIDGDTRSTTAPWIGADEAADDPCAGKVVICHIPPGNPGNEHTICIGAPAVPAHIAHGCYVGPCGFGAKNGGAFGMDDGVLNASPNPFSDQITLEYGSLHTENMTVSIYSVTGQLVKTIEISNVEDGAVNSTTVDTQDLPSGMYLAKFTYEGAEITKKIVKE